MSMGAGVPASMGRRLLAALVDAALALVVVGLPVALAVRPVLADPATPPAGAWLAVGAGGTVLLVATQWVLLGRHGWTLGKRWLGVLVLSERSGFPPGLGAAALRLLVPALAGVVPALGPLLVHVSPYFDVTGRRQGWHDRAAGTLVVDARHAPAGAAQVERRLQRLMTPDGAAAPPAPERAAPAGRTEAAPTVPTPVVAMPAVPPVPPVPPVRAVRAVPPLPTGPGPAPAAPSLPPTRGLVPGTRVVPPAEPVTAVPFQHRREGEDVEATRLRPARAKVPEVAAADHEATVEITDGQRVTFTGAALVGRNPTPRADEAGFRLITVADPGRSVSKTHLLLGVDRTGLWVKDRHSTNGTVVTLADGQQILCGADQQVRLPPGASVAFGDYGLSVATVDAV